MEIFFFGTYTYCAWPISWSVGLGSSGVKVIVLFALLFVLFLPRCRLCLTLFVVGLEVDYSCPMAADLVGGLSSVLSLLETVGIGLLFWDECCQCCHLLHECGHCV